MNEKLLLILSRIKTESGGDLKGEVTLDTDLRKDLSFSSLDLATLTAEIEDEFGVDACVTARTPFT